MLSSWIQNESQHGLENIKHKRKEYASLQSFEKNWKYNLRLKHLEKRL